MSVTDVVEGEVKWFDKEKRYGFIKTPVPGLEVFVHENQLKESGIDRPLVEGEKVKFRIGKGPKGPFANSISLATEKL